MIPLPGPSRPILSTQTAPVIVPSVHTHRTVLHAIRSLRPLEAEQLVDTEGDEEEDDDNEGEEENLGDGRVEAQVVANLKRRSMEAEGRSLLEPTKADMKQMAFILANVSDSLDQQPEVALSAASQNMGWLFARDVPTLTQMLLTEYPSLRQDTGMLRGYMFLLDFLEAVGKETSSLLKKNQKALKLLFDAMKVSEAEVDRTIAEHANELTSPEFLLYLDSEIEAQDTNTPMEGLLVTVKLRLLEEAGRALGYDVTIIPKLASEEDPAELRRKTLEHVQSYESLGGKELFLQALRLMRREMKMRYNNIDPLLLLNLDEVEKITLGLIQRGRKEEEEAADGV